MKKIKINISPRIIRITATISMLIVFFICLYNFMNIMFYRATGNDQCGWLPMDTISSRMYITQISPGGVADEAGLKEGDILLKINGQNFKYNEAMGIINHIPFGQYATYTVERNGVQFDTQIRILKVFDFNYLTKFLLGLGFLIVGYVVIMTKPKGKTQQGFAIFSATSMMFFSLFELRLSKSMDPAWLINTMIVLALAGIILGPPFFVKFFLLFPHKRNIRHKILLNVVLFLLSTTFLIIILLNNSYNFLYDTIKLVIIFPYLYYFAGFILFIHGYYKYVELSRRKELRPILYSIIIGGAALAYTVILGNAYPFSIYIRPLLFAPGIFIIFIPLAFGYSIFKYRLMDTELIVKRSLIYAIVTAGIAVVYLLMVYGLGNFMGDILGQPDSQALTIFAFIVIAIAFDPFKRRVQDWIDRIFYQERYNYQKVLSDFSRELPTQINLEQILNSLVNTISNTMHVEKICVSVCDSFEGCHAVNKNINPADCNFDKVETGLISLLLESKTPLSFALLAQDPDSYKIDEADKQKLLSSGAVLVVPMFLQNRLIGMINIGPKKSGKVYSKEDIDLLSTVAGQAAIAIENARLHISEIKRKLMEEELSLARKIQQGLLPKENPDIKELDITGISIPALSVGGDYYDFIKLDDKRLLIVVADVSGKGMSAALYMSKIQGMVQLAAYMYKSPKEILNEVNRRIYESIERNSFITMILALFDLETRKVSICRAGHSKPLIRTNGKFEYVSSEGIGLGLEKGPLFEETLEEKILPISPGAVYMFYSDGLNEAMNEKAVEYGEDNIYKIVKENDKLPAKDLQKTIINSVDKFRGTAEQNDDLTLVIVKSR
jgi:phosphoserine phosphatase RsbU/P